MTRPYPVSETRFIASLLAYYPQPARPVITAPLIRSANLLLLLLLAVAVPVEAETDPAASGWIGVVLPLEAIDVAAQAAGRLQEVNVRAGAEVERGQLLARIDSRTAIGDQKIAKAELEMAEAELARSEAHSKQEASRHKRRSTTKELWSEEELSSTEVEARSAEAETRAAQAQVERARATVEQLKEVLEQLEIRAPFSGHVSIRYLDPGAVVATGSIIARLVSSQALLVRFAVPPGQIDRLALGAWVEVNSANGEPIGRARVRRISPEIDLASQRIFAEAILDTDTLSLEPKGGLGARVRPGAEARPDAQERALE